jgi:amphiphysin
VPFLSYILKTFQKKIEKRGRKLIDFDKERHNVQQMQANPSRNEAKFAR